MQYNVQWQKPVKLVKHIVSFIGKELTEDCRSCDQVLDGPMAVIILLTPRIAYT